MSSSKRLRLPGYDYSARGAYFVTINSAHRRKYFGSVKDEKMVLSPIGRAVDGCWNEIPAHHHNVRLDLHQLMPDHFHGILFLEANTDTGTSSTPSGIVQLNNPTGGNEKDIDRIHNDPTSTFFSRISPKKNTLGVIIRTFKAAVTTWCRENGFPEFGWQSRYYDRIIRNSEELNRIRHYIQMNPRNYGKH